MKSAALTILAGLGFGCSSVHGTINDKNDGVNEPKVNWNPSTLEFVQWMESGSGQPFSSGANPYQLLTRVLTRLEAWANDKIVSGNVDITEASEYPYWNFLPSYLGSVVPNGGPAKFSGECFDFTSTAVYTADGNVNVNLFASKTSLAPCSDIILLKTVTGMLSDTIESPGSYDYSWVLPTDATTAEIWDLQTSGIRYHRMPFSEPVLLHNLLATLKLFVPLYTQHIPDAFMEMNRDFLESYTDYTFPDRTSSDDDFAINDVRSGDLFSVSRFDGMAPAMMFGMGSKSGHTTMALEIDGEMYIVQSTDASAYWPTANIQRTLISDWVDMVRDADYLGVHLPLSAESRSRFNETAAVEFFLSVEGFAYGYNNFIFGWIDMLKDNFPCMPPDYSSVCMQWEFLETLMAMIDRTMPDVSTKMWNQAFDHRLGTDGLRTAELYQEAFNQGLTSNDLITIVEQDDWLYQTTRNGQPAVGPSFVCDVFACRTLKAAGVFGDVANDLNCVEFSDFDVFALPIFEGTMTQFTGLYEFDLADELNTKGLYAHEAEACPTIPPSYLGREVC